MVLLLIPGEYVQSDMPSNPSVLFLKMRIQLESNAHMDCVNLQEVPWTARSMALYRNFCLMQ